jgi:hypothetical protein
LSACCTLIVVACSVPPSSLVPRAAMHLPWANACASVAVCLVYFVVSVTVTLVVDGLPLASAPVTVMVLPATDEAVPLTPAWCLDSGHLPSTAWLTRTD